MTAVIQIGVLEQAIDATFAKVSSENSDYPFQNLFRSNALVWETAAATNESIATFDFGFGNTKSINYAAFRDLGLLLDKNTLEGSIELYVEGSNDDFLTSATIFSDTNVQSSDLVGPESTDYLFVQSSPSTAYRYIRFRIYTNKQIIHSFRGFGMGTLFDFEDRSPVPGYSGGFGGVSRAFLADSGSLFKTSMGKRRREHSFSWNGVTDAVRNDFEQKISRWIDDYPFFLYGPTGETHDPLGGRVLLFGWITDAPITMGQWNADHRVGISFIEDVA